MATIIYTDDLPEGIGGKCIYPFYPKYGECIIKLRPKYEHDAGILKHELCHEKQYKRSFWHSLNNIISAEYRYECEIEAYTEQIREYGYVDIRQAFWIIDALLTKYNLDKTRQEIVNDLIKIIKEQ